MANKTRNAKSILAKIGWTCVGLFIVVCVCGVLAWLVLVIGLAISGNFRDAFLAFVIPPFVLTAIIGCGQQIEP